MIVVIGGGPAGFFAAITAREMRPEPPVTLLEKTGRVLRKVSISGGGRCNVTHDCGDARTLAQSYPRGGRELIGPFTRWAPADTVAWFADRGVELKTEPDGRMFPVTDSSATIVDCLRDAAGRAGVRVLTRQAVTGVARRPEGGFRVEIAEADALECERLVLATGGKAAGDAAPGEADGYSLARALGHDIVPPVPSLFTFHLEDKRWFALAGLAVDPVVVKAFGEGLPAKGLASTGPMLLTHWGVSGPAVLKLSAFGARLFHELDYRFELRVDWLPDTGHEKLDELLTRFAAENPRKTVAAGGPTALPRRLWREHVLAVGIDESLKWADLGRKPRLRLAEQLKATRWRIVGKSTFKDEFVTCGGVPLKEVDLRTMQSRVCPGLFLAGEVLDIDGLTGGYNFQAAWTTGRLAGLALAEEGEPK